MLTDDQILLVNYLYSKLNISRAVDDLANKYYEGTQRLSRIGIAVPESLAEFETVVNWPRLVVGALEERCDVRGFSRAGTYSDDAEMRQIWDSNNLDSRFTEMNVDKLVFGRCPFTIGAREGGGTARIVPESALEVAVKRSPRTGNIEAALKVYSSDLEPGSPLVTARPMKATLYLPDVTLWLGRGRTGKWSVEDRDEHKMGVVPVGMLRNNARIGTPDGQSEINDAMAFTDAAARSLTNLQIAAETHSVPQKWVVGASKGDFKDKDGNVIPAWESYFTAIWANSSKDVQFGQFAASDLKNFHDTVTHYSGLLAGLYGLPTRYFGQNTANPPSAEGIKADEARLVKRADRKNRADGDELGRMMAIAIRIESGEWPDAGGGSRIRVDFHDPGTPTVSARVDQVNKLTGGAVVLSREGAWDELGWDEPRKEVERQRLAAETPIVSAGVDSSAESA